MVVRICAGLRQAVASLDETRATMRRRIDNVNAAIGLLSESVSDTEDRHLPGQPDLPFPLAGNARHHDRPN